MAKGGSPNGQKTLGILRSHGDRAVTYFAAHFEPQIGYAKRLPNIVESVQKRGKIPHWASTAEKYLLRETNKKFFYMFDHHGFHCQTLGLEPWTANIDDHFEAMSIAFQRMEVTRLKRLGFQVSIQLPLEMTHPEICDLMFGSFLVDRETLSSTYGKVDDLMLQLYGYYKGIRSQTTIAPQTTEQSRKTFLSTANLDTFVEPKYLDTCVKDHYERVSTDCLNLIVEMIKEDTPISGLRSLLDDCLEGTETIAEGTVLRLKALKPKGQVTHGDTSQTAS